MRASEAGCGMNHINCLMETDWNCAIIHLYLYNISVTQIYKTSVLWLS